LVLPGSVVVFTLVLRILSVWSASTASYQFLLTPLVTLLVAAALVGELPTPAFVLGGAVVLLGVYIGAFSRRRAAAPVAATTRRAAAGLLAASPGELVPAPAYRVAPPPAGTC
ncbi:MAG: hypothetical protein ACHQ15_08650, partial [Candidatus Limnocylindrales bacterium]